MIIAVLFSGLVVTAVYYACARLTRGMRRTAPMDHERAPSGDDDLDGPGWTPRDDRTLTRLLKDAAP